MSPWPVGERKRLTVLLLLSLAVKFCLWGVVLARNSEGWIVPDSSTYINPARSLLHLGTFALSPEHPDIPMVIRTPGYPAFLAVVYSIFGVNQAAAVAVQLGVSVLNILILYVLARRLFDSRVALAAGGLLALDNVSMALSLVVLSETLFTFFLLLFLLSMTNALAGHPTPKSWILSGLFLSLATYVRPVSYLLIFPTLLGLGMVFKKLGWGVATLLKCAGWLLLPYVMLVGGWQIRNGLRCGHFTFSSIVGMNRGIPVIVLRDGISIEEARNRVSGGRWEEQIQEAYLHPERDLLRERGEAYFDLISRHPWLWLESVVLQDLRTIFGTGESRLLQLLSLPSRKPGPVESLLKMPPGEYIRTWVLGSPLQLLLSLYAGLYLVVLYGLMIGRLSKSWRRRRSRPAPTGPAPETIARKQVAILYLWGVALYLWLITGFQATDHRYRAPIVPIFCLSAAAGLVSLRNNFESESLGSA